MCAAAWMQVVLLSGFKWDVAIRALHKAVHSAYQTSPRAISATVKCLYNMTRHMPECRCVVVSKVGTWLQKNANSQTGKLQTTAHGCYQQTWLYRMSIALRVGSLGGVREPSRAATGQGGWEGYEVHVSLSKKKGKSPSAGDSVHVSSIHPTVL